MPIIQSELIRTLRERAANTGDPIYGYAADEIERLEDMLRHEQDRL